MRHIGSTWAEGANHEYYPKETCKGKGTVIKYVMFTNAQGIKVPVLFADHLTHADIKVGKGWTATSAGQFGTDGKCQGQSESLKLSPMEDDTIICGLVLCNMESMLLVQQDFEANKARLEWVKKRNRRQLKAAAAPQQ